MKRYSLEIDYYEKGSAWMKEDPEGDYVKVEEQAERDKRLADLKEWLMNKALNSTGNYQTAMRDTLAELAGPSAEGKEE